MSTSEAERELWRRYRDEGDLEARDALFMHHAAWSKLVAKDVYFRLRLRQLELADYVQNASIGLLEAMSRFDVARGVDFRAYAKARVRGAVFNGVRSLLAEPKAERRLSDRLDMFEHAGDVDPLDAMIDTVAGLGVSYLLDVASAAGAGEPDASAYASSAHGERVLLDAIDRLPDRLGMIISAHYFHHVPFVQIAERLSLTKGRVSQLHRQAIDRLRESIREQGIMGAGDV